MYFRITLVIFQSKVWTRKVMYAIDISAEMALAALVPGEAPVYIEQEGGTLVVDKNTANDMSNRDYSLNGGSMKLMGNLTSDPSQVFQLKVMALTF